MSQVKIYTPARITKSNSSTLSTGESISEKRRSSSSKLSGSNSSLLSNASSSSKTKSHIPQRPHPRETLVEIRRRTTGKPVDHLTLINAVKANYPFIFRINDGIGTANTILQDVCKERGWEQFEEVMPGMGRAATYYDRSITMRSATGWNLWWSYSMYQFSPYKYLRPWQFTNHHPKGFQFCNKLYLTMYVKLFKHAVKPALQLFTVFFLQLFFRYLRKMKSIHGPIFDFYPHSFIIPEDYYRLSLEHNKRATSSSSLTSFNNLLPTSDIPLELLSAPVSPDPVLPKRLRSPPWGKYPPPELSPADICFVPVWISKPVAQSQGRGIYITPQIPALATEKKSVVQEYISRPLLLGGYKWDMRIYVCVAAIDPLVIYIYEEGLCRFCTEKYETRDLSKTYSHLTNASLNKLSPTYPEDKELIGTGCKWSLQKLRQYFKGQGIPDWLLWQRIMSMVVLTVIGDSLRLDYSASNRSYFDLFGFDVMVDENLKPWLLECNYSPGLGGDCETDELVKRPMLHELFDLLGFPDSTTCTQPTSPVRPRTQEKVEAKEMECSKIGSGDNASVTFEKDTLTRHYFELLLEKLKQANDAIMGPTSVKTKPTKKWTTSCNFTPEARLMAAKSIYSQNLVVQYLKNQSQGKLTNKARDQLITLAAKKLKNKLVANSKYLDISKNTGKRNKSHSPVRMDSATQYDCKDCMADHWQNTKAYKTRDVAPAPPQSAKAKKPRPKSAPSTARPSSASGSSTFTIPTSCLLGKLRKEFPHPESDAFQKLKHYFDAGVDYPLDLETGRFKHCPALLTFKRDWFNATKTQGGWIRVYP